MKIALVIAVYKRHDLTKIVLDNFRLQAKKYGFEIIIAGSEGNASKRLAKCCHYIEVDNDPLSDKHDAMITKAKELDVDGVVLMGSDDIVSDSYWDWVYSLDSNAKYLQGLKDIYFYSTKHKQLYYWAGYRNGKQIAGAGRFFSRFILDKMDWQLWDSGLQKGLDTNCSSLLLKKGIKEKSVTMQEINAILVDVKHEYSITNLAIVNNCEKVNNEIMASKVRKTTTKKVEELEPKVEVAPKKIYSANDKVRFKSNGKSKHLPFGSIHELDGLKANYFLNAGFGEIID